MNLGTRLRNARQARRTSLHAISAATKISMHLLEAIEHNQIGQLPGGIFTRAYLRAYAVQVGLDPEQVVRDYVAEAEPRPQVEDELQKLRARCAARDSGRRSGWRLIALLGPGVALIAVLWVYSGSERRRAAFGPLELSEAVTAVRALSVEPSARGPASESAVNGEEHPGVRLEIESRELCRISAETDGGRVIYRLMQPGERVVIDAGQYIVLRVGNAGAFLYWINGSPGRSLGRPGDAVTARITEDNYRSFLAEGMG